MIKIEKVGRSPEGKVLSVRVLVDGYKEFLFVAKNGKIVQVSSSSICKESWKKMFKRVVAIFHPPQSNFHSSEKSEGEDQQISLNL